MIGANDICQPWVRKQNISDGNDVDPLVPTQSPDPMPSRLQNANELIVSEMQTDLMWLDSIDCEHPLTSYVPTFSQLFIMGLDQPC